MKKNKELVLTDHGYERFVERITWMPRRDAERFVSEEVKVCKVKESLREGCIGYIVEGIKYVVKGNNIVTVIYL